MDDLASRRKARELERIFDLARLAGHLASVAEKRTVLVQALSAVADPRHAGVMPTLFDGLFDSTRMEERARQHLDRRHDPEIAGRALARLDNEAAARMFQLEDEAGRPEQRPSLRDFLAAVRERPLADERIAALSRVDDACGATTWMAGLQDRITEAAIAAMGDPQADAAAGARAQARAYRDAAPGLQLLAYALREVPDGDLVAHCDVLSTDEGRWFVEVTRGALETAISADFARLGENLASVIDRTSAGMWFPKPRQ